MLSFISCTDREECAKRAALFLQQKITAAQQADGVCIVGLAGGRTPRGVYEEFGRMFRGAPHPTPLPMGEGNIRFFLVDERYVPVDHPESNQRMVRETLLQHLSVPEAHIVFPDTSLPIDECVADYTRRLKNMWAERLPHLIILGMGTDGHIASLFPPLSDFALGDERLVLHTRAPEGIGPPDVRDRITLSLNAICAADEQLLLLQGEEKKRTWEEMLSSLSCRNGSLLHSSRVSDGQGGDEGEGRWPLKRVIATGNLTVMRPETATA
ncbi:6-phosphogluconolactonase [Candidatus Peregrinibacteria bacterium]|nr:6-phosphogluconolactonase [Candidatus Peregrinibacteria bacterium]MBI4129065.1 6-phosphogluconolactonase [Candidatus Peregrinibacteria bacterium]